MRKLFLIISLPIIMAMVSPYKVTVATKYYFSQSGSDGGSGTIGSPWKTLTKFETESNGGTFAAGDSIFFNRTDTFTGHIQVGTTGGRHVKSGTAGAHIVVSSYGTGALPMFLCDDPSATAEGRTLFQFWGIRFWDFYNMNFTDTNTVNDHTTMSNTRNGFPLYLGDPGTTPCNRIRVENCTWTLTGMGIVIYGDSCIFTNNTMSNFKVLKNNNNSGDYGSNPFTILDGNYNEISHNNISQGWSASDFFGYSGGFCEMFGACSHNQFLYNTIDDCNGISEFGSNGATATADSNVYAYNRSTNNGALFYANISGIFALDVANLFYYQAVATEQNGITRFSGTNLGAGLTGTALAASLASPDTRSFGYNGSPPATFVYICKDNVYQNNTAMDIYQSGTTKVSHTYNYYKLSGGSVPNVTLGPTEATGSATIFTNTVPSNSNAWNLRPIVSSAIWNTGQTISSYGTDFAGNPISNNMGLYGPDVPVVTNAIFLPGYIKNGSTVRHVDRFKN